MQITIWRATINDAATLSVIARQTFYDTFKDTCTVEDMQSFLEEFFNEEALTKELSDENDHCYFAEQEGVLMAYIRFKEDEESFPVMNQWKAIELKRIYVLKTFLGNGIAQQLMDFFIDYAQQHKYEAIWLGVWEHNLRAQRFYEKYGFQNSGHTHDFPIGKTPQTDFWLWKFL